MNSSKEFQNFLDQKQYNRRGILKYEFIFGEDFVSVGGAELNRELSKKLDIKPEHRVLERVQNCCFRNFIFSLHVSLNQ